MCHIHAASPGGPRFDPNQSDTARNEAENLIILCPTHHSLIDQDPSIYTADALRKMKSQHEDRVATSLSAVIVALDDQQAMDFARQVADESVDFAIIVALPKELAAVRRFFPELEQVTAGPSSSRSYYRGVVPTARGGSYRLVVTMLHSMGNLEAAHATADLIREWSPRFVLVNGIAGGLARQHQDFGDIVASDSVVYYELAKVRSGGQDRRSRQFPADPTLLDGILNLTGSAWRRRLPPRPDGTEADDLHPRIHVGPIASGEKVIAAVEAADDLRSTQPNLIAVEMESAGVASAAFGAVKKVGFLTIRAICDFADASKGDDWREYAALSAASCLREFVESRPVALSEGTWPKTGPPREVPKEQFSTTVRKKLFDQLCDAFDMEEFKNLCFLLCLDINEIPGDRKSARVRELILLFERRNNLDMLEEAVQGNLARPDLASSRATPGLVSERPIIREKSAAEILINLKGGTPSYQFNKKADELYRGRWTREPGWQVTVHDLPSKLSEGLWHCSFREVGSGALVMASTAQDVASLRPGDFVTITGSIMTVSLLDYVCLEDGIIRWHVGVVRILR
jgi:nucleoside phosphorylase